MRSANLLEFLLFQLQGLPHIKYFCFFIRLSQMPKREGATIGSKKLKIIGRFKDRFLKISNRFLKISAENVGCLFPILSVNICFN